MYATDLGRYLLNFPELLKLMTHATMVFEYIGPFLLLIPWAKGSLRTLGIFLFLGLHAGFALTLNIGLFPLISSVSFLALIPSDFWDALKKKIPEPKAITAYYDADCNFCKKSIYIIRSFLGLNALDIKEGQDNKTIYKLMEHNNSWVVTDEKGEAFQHYTAFLKLLENSPTLFWLNPLLGIKFIQVIGNLVYKLVANNRFLFSIFTKNFSFYNVKFLVPSIANGMALLLLIFIFLWNFQHVNKDFKIKKPYKNFAYWIRIDQKWNMFAPKPFTADGWFVFPGKLKNGKEIDLFNKENNYKLTWEKPDSVYDSHDNYRWRKYMRNMAQKKNKKTQALVFKIYM